jgi:E-phenylitaconyl-CoA hydratase
MSIDLTVEDGIASIIINRPDRLNAMDAEHYEALSQAWTTVRDDPRIRVAVVTGAGDRAFSVGADLKSFIARAPELAELMLTQR